MPGKMTSVPARHLLRQSAQFTETVHSVLDEIAATENITYLFTTKICPNCRTEKSILDGYGVNYHVVNAKKNKVLVLCAFFIA